jgi:single-strand DNA-binding protein
MNVVTLVGNLTADPETKGEGESRVCRLRLAVNGPERDGPLYITVAAFGRQAQNCARYLRKGREVAVSGRLRLREWEGGDGTRRSEHSIAAERVDFLAGGPRSSAAEEVAVAQI